MLSFLPCPLLHVRGENKEETKFNCRDSKPGRKEAVPFQQEQDLHLASSEIHGDIKQVTGSSFNTSLPMQTRSRFLLAYSKIPRWQFYLSKPSRPQ